MAEVLAYTCPETEVRIMTTIHTSAEIVEQDGVLVGPLREPRTLLGEDRR